MFPVLDTKSRVVCYDAPCNKRSEEKKRKMRENVLVGTSRDAREECKIAVFVFCVVLVRWPFVTPFIESFVESIVRRRTLNAASPLFSVVRQMYFFESVYKPVTERTALG